MFFFKIFFSSFNKGCIKPGVYGSNCDTSCPIHCKNNDCHIQNGMCFECNPGWNGATCQKSIMIILWWFSDTSLRIFFYIFFFLSVFLVVNYLNFLSKVIFFSIWIECENGWHGEKCSQKCVGNCMNNSTCNHVTGHCDLGCNAGWKGSMCDKGNLKLLMFVRCVKHL